MNLKTLLFPALLIASVAINAQQRQRITLEEALAIAEEQSLEAMVARNLYLTAYWQYRSYRADLFPNIVLEGTFPSLNRSLTPYQKEDGTYGFVRNSALIEELAIGVSQNIPLTGGNISVYSALQRIDQLGDRKSTGYMSVPYTLTLNQPLFNPKTLKWAMKIEPERFKEARQQYQSNIESVYMKTIDYYFELLLAQANLDIAHINRDNATKLHNIAKGKKELGLISDNDLLQLELAAINAQAAIISARQTLDKQMISFRNFLRINHDVELSPVIPETLFDTDISLNEVRELAAINNPLTHNSRRLLLEARQQIDIAKTNRGFKADIAVSFGNTGSDLTLPDSYRNLQQREIASLGIRIPILDWGKGSGRVKLAESQNEVVKSQVEQTELNFEQNIILSVTQYKDQGRLVALAQHADSLARLRYETAFQTFVMGTINVLDINAAQVERDNARRKYINELYLSWLCYYNLRQLTLFDFKTQSEIRHSQTN
ncbi:MAG: TolC family protein [Dysgonamonadaceae bacterium]|jgi:outer membrane protein TolC|nr:TolC family protein [Dysgonamonadaceae bacterium]